MKRLAGFERVKARTAKLEAQKEKSERILQAKMEKRRQVSAQLKAAEDFALHYWERSMGRFLTDLGFQPEHEEKLKQHIRTLAKKLLLAPQENIDQNTPSAYAVISANGESE
jgi:glutamyl-tRNA reductase